jgi:hypothetical protein
MLLDGMDEVRGSIPLGSTTLKSRVVAATPDRLHTYGTLVQLESVQLDVQSATPPHVTLHPEVHDVSLQLGPVHWSVQFPPAQSSVTLPSP